MTRRTGANEIARRARTTLVSTQAAFEVTGNPIYAWCAMSYCLANRREIPAWLRLYLIDAADAIVKHRHDTSMTGSEKLRRVEKALRKALRLQRRGRNIFDHYDDVQLNRRAADNFSIRKAFIRDKQGKPIQEKAIIGDVQGMHARKARQRLAEGRAIERRALEIAKEEP